jgi:opacity protein-like surface antigen
MIDPQGVLKNINFNYSYQTTNNKSYLLKNNKTAIHSLNIGSGIGLSENIIANLTAGLISSSIFDTTKTTTQNYALMLQHIGFANKLNSTANISAAFSEENSAIRFTIGSGYQISIMDNVSISISYLKFKGNNNNGSNFNEVLAGINYSHRF